MPEEGSLLEFPCDFPLKVMGLAREGFAQTIADVVRQHDAAFDPATMGMRPSTGGKYLSLTCTVHATSKAQLDALYRALSGHPDVKVVL
jgi:putative lipoic acid-binding regulatory protein